MSRPRILYLGTRFPWPFDRGDRMRAYRLIEQFSRHADVTLASFHERPAVEAPVDRLLPLCERVEVIEHPPGLGRLNMLAGLAGREPFQVRYYRSEAMDRLVDRLAREPWDLVFAQLFRLRPYLDRFPGAHRVIELSDSLRLNLSRAMAVKRWYARPAFAEELRRVTAYETETLRRVDEAWVVAEPDRVDLLARVPGANVRVIPNGLVTRWGGAGLEGPKEPVVLFLGNLTVGHNLDTARWLAGSIWPLVIARVPAARLLLVGSAGAQAHALGRLPGVETMGFVDDLAPLLRRARLSAAPLRYGAGLQNKVIEAMAAGLPVVVTPIVNEPIGAAPDGEIVVADGVAAQAQAIVRLLGDAETAAAIGRRAREFALARYDWARAGERMKEILDALPGGPPPSLASAPPPAPSPAARTR